MERLTDVQGGVELRVENGVRSLYARKDFRQGQRVLDLPLLTIDQPDKYSIEVRPGTHLDCSFALAGAINHNCTPNIAVYQGKIVAWTCIKAGEELFLDYLRTESEISYPFDCNCGSKNCKGRIK